MTNKILLGILTCITIGLGFYWQHTRDLEKLAFEAESPFVIFTNNIQKKPITGRLTVSVHPLNNPRAIMKIALNPNKEEKNRFKIERLLTLIKLSGIHLEANKIDAYEKAFLTIQVKHKNTIFSLPVSNESYKTNIQLKNFFKLFQVYSFDLQNKDSKELAKLP